MVVGCCLCVREEWFETQGMEKPCQPLASAWDSTGRSRPVWLVKICESGPLLVSLLTGGDQWVTVKQDVYDSNHLSINPLQNLMSLLRNTKQTNNIPITIRFSLTTQPSVWED